jgi:alkaline phosphatase D
MNYHAFMSGRVNGGGPASATAGDKQLGYPAFAAMLALKPDFFIGTGDIVYYDQPSASAAGTLPELRRKWHEQFRFPRLTEFFAHTPAFWSKDDHDFRFNDADHGGDKLPAPTAGIEMFREQMPILPAGDLTTPTYRTHRIHRDVQLWFTEGRDFRSPNRMPDGPEKSLWGTEQREWLKRTLKDSDATWKIIITPTPMVGPDDASKKDNHTSAAGFRHEATAFFSWAIENGVGPLMTFCGDRHWQYHSIHPSGIEEFACGALNDENSRKGVAPGARNSTDPDALIKQPYTYPKPTGGFLRVTVGPDESAAPRLEIEFRDDTGAVLHRVRKSAAK